MQTITLYPREGRQDVSLKALILDDSPDLLNGKPRPGVLVCPGGGYFNCSDREAEPVALRFATQGFHTFVLRYSTYCEGGAFPDLSKDLSLNERSLYPNALRDIGQAFLMLHEHAEEWKLDMDRIAVCGFSAGGHNAALYATDWYQSVISDYFQKPASLFRPAAAILGYPLTDYVYKDEVESQDTSMVRNFFEASNIAFLGAKHPDADTLEQVSPARHVSEKTPPCFLWATASDELVPVQHSLIMARALADHKIPFEIHVFESGQHGLSLADQSAASAKSELNPPVSAWSDLAATWLQRRFTLDLPDLTPFEQMMANGGNPGAENS